MFARLCQGIQEWRRRSRAHDARYVKTREIFISKACKKSPMVCCLAAGFFGKLAWDNELLVFEYDSRWCPYGIQRRDPCPGCVPCRLAAKKIVQVLKAAASISFHTVTDMTRYDSYFWIWEFEIQLMSPWRIEASVWCRQMHHCHWFRQLSKKQNRCGRKVLWLQLFSQLQMFQVLFVFILFYIAYFKHPYVYQIEHSEEQNIGDRLTGWFTGRCGDWFEVNSSLPSESMTTEVCWKHSCGVMPCRT